MKTGKPAWAAPLNPIHAACFASGYGDYIIRKCFQLAKQLKLDSLETDGPYDGFICYSKKHRHRSPAQSQYRQWEMQRKFYAEAQRRGIFIYSPHAPSSVLHGNNRMCCGAECWMPNASEINGSMNRLYNSWEQIVTVRQDLWFTSFVLPPNCMFHNLSSWDFIGEDEETLDHWLATSLGYGVTAGFRAKLTDQNEPVFKKWVDFFKRNRKILESDIVHLLPPDGKSIDAIMHLNPELDPSGLIMAYNPTGLDLRQTIVFPVKYFSNVGALRVKDKEGKTLALNTAKDPLAIGITEGYMDNGQIAQFDVRLAPREITWFEISRIV